MRYILIFLALGMPIILRGQPIVFGVVSGRVVDAANLPLAYVSVQARGSNFGTHTDEQGLFLLRLPAGQQVLQLQLQGYASGEVATVVEAGKEVRTEAVLTAETNLLRGVEVSGVRAKTLSATRTLLEVQEIPQAMVVIGQKTIRQQAAFDLTTLTRNMSGLNFTGNYSGAGSYQLFNARGFDMTNAQNYRWNGMMMWNLGNHYGDNIEQVEFLKGPTSILFGDVAPGGVLNFSTKKPLSTPYVGVDLKLGTWKLLRPSLDLSGPLNASKTLRYRLNTSYQREASFRDYVESSRYLLAPTLAWDLTPRLNWTVEGMFRQSASTDDPGLVSPDGTAAGLDLLSPSLYLSEPTRKYRYRDQSLFSTLTWRIGDNWRIRNVLFAGNTRNRPWGIWPATPDEDGSVQRSEFGYHQGLRNASANLDAYGSFFTGSIKHNLLVGFEFQGTRFRYTNEGYLDSLDMNNIYQMRYGLVPANAPEAAPYLPFVSIIGRGGFYFQDQLMFFRERLHLLLGIRAGRTSQGNDYLENELEGTDYEGYTDDIVNRGLLTPRIGLVFKASERWNFYASYAQGYEINAPDIFAQNYADFANPPATNSRQWEGGMKGSLMQNTLGVSFTLFQIDKFNPYGYVYADPDNPDFDNYFVYYDGHHQSRGVEIDIDGRLAPWLSVTAGGAYTQAAIITDPGYPTGNLLPNVPQWMGNIWLNVEPQQKMKGFTLGGGIFYKDRFFSGLDNQADLRVRSGTTVDLAAGYQHKRYGIQLNATNVLNRVNYLNPWVFNLFDVQPLRRWILTLSYRL
jgi:iron complex outermembrane receptor protein